jgi:xylulokinase
MRAALALGLDIGTTNVKLALVAPDRRPRIVARASASHPTSRPRPGWAEQEPAAWWAATGGVLRSARGRLGDVVAVAISGQGSTFALCERDGTPQAEAVGWQDLRAAAELPAIERTLRPLLDRAHGNAIGDAPEPKLVWLARERPREFSRGELALTAASVVGVRLGAEPALNEGDAGGWLSWDRHGVRWSTEIARRLGIEQLLPPVVRAGTLIGQVSSSSARETGIPAGTRVFASTTDVAAAALAAGVGRPGEVFFSKGTGGFVCCNVESIRDPRPLLALPFGRDGIVQLCGGTDTLGAAWDWCRGLVGGVGHDEAERLASAAAPGSGGVVFLPWLQGAHHPVLEPNARAVVFGLSLETTPGHLLRSVLEGTAIALRQHLAIARSVAKGEFHLIVCSGGPTGNALWNRLDAAAAETAIVIAPESDAAVGSALIAGEAAGLWPSALAAGELLRAGAPVVEPEPELSLVARHEADLSAEAQAAASSLFAPLAQFRQVAS